MFFPHDYVGGPVRQHFGGGIRDIELGSGSSWLGWFFLSFPHSSYWRRPRRSRNHAGYVSCTDELRRIIQRPPTLMIESAPSVGVPRPHELGRFCEALEKTPKGPDLLALDLRISAIDQEPVEGGSREVQRRIWFPSGDRVYASPELYEAIRSAFDDGTQYSVLVSPDARVSDKEPELEEPEEISEPSWEEEVNEW